jgi:hypothetical protein
MPPNRGDEWNETEGLQRVARAGNYRQMAPRIAELFL